VTAYHIDWDLLRLLLLTRMGEEGENVYSLSKRIGIHRDSMGGFLSGRYTHLDARNLVHVLTYLSIYDWREVTKEYEGTDEYRIG